MIVPFYSSEALLKGVSTFQSGIVLAAGFLVIIFSSLIFGKMIDQFNKRTMLSLGTCALGVGYLILGFLGSIEDTFTFFIWSVQSRLLIGIGDSVSTLAAFKLAEMSVSKRSRGKAISFAEFWYSIGENVGPVAGGALYDTSGFFLPCALTGALAILLAFISCSVIRGGKCDDDELNDSSPNSSREASSSSVAAILTGICLFFASTARWWYAPSLAPFLKSTFHFSASQSGLVILAHGLTYTVATPCVGLLVDLGVSVHFTVLVCNTMVVMAYAMLSFTNEFPCSTNSKSSMLIFAIGLQGVGDAGIFMGTLLYLTAVMDTTGSSLWLAVYCFGALSGSSLGGLVSETLGFSSAALMILVCISGLTVCSATLLYIYKL